MCFLPDPRSTQGVDLPQPRRSDKHYEFSKYFDMVEIPLGDQPQRRQALVDLLSNAFP
jgi:hypothetical protein